MDEALRKEIFAAIASLAPPGVDDFPDSAALARPPLNLTGAGMTVLALKLSRIAAARGGTPISAQEIRAAKTVGRCVKLVKERIRR